MTTSRADKKKLMDKLAGILAAGDVYQDETIAELTEIIRKSYINGLQSGPPLAVVSLLVTEASIAKAAKSMSERVGLIWNFLGTDISNTIKSGIKAGQSYEEVAASVDDLIRSGWGDEVDFDNRGNVIRRVKVDPFTGETSWENHTITEPKTMKTEDYATTISQTVVHESWNKARDDQFESIGLEKYVHSSVCDGATRPDHLAMHGKIIERGSDEDAKSEAIRSDYNCRCLQIPYWDDPELDGDPQVYEDQKQEAARQARKLTPDGTVKADTLDAILGESKEHMQERIVNESETTLLNSKTFNKKIVDVPVPKNALKKGTKEYDKFVSDLSKEISSDKNVAARMKNMDVKPKDLAEQMTETLDKNFAYSKTRGTYTFKHVYNDHAEKEGFTLGEVVKANSNNPTIYKNVDNSKRLIIYKRSNGKTFIVARGTDSDKLDNVITTYTESSEKKIKKIMGWEKE